MNDVGILITLGIAGLSYIWFGINGAIGITSSWFLFIGIVFIIQKVKGNM